MIAPPPASKLNPRSAAPRQQLPRAAVGDRTSPLTGWRSEVVAAIQLNGLSIVDGIATADPDAVTRAGGADAAASAAEAELAAHAERNSDWIMAATQRARAILRSPESAARFEEFGALMERVALVQEAAAGYRRALTLDPTLQHCRYRLGVCCQQSGRLDEARQQWTELVGRYPTDGKGHARLAVICYYLNDDAAAWRHLRSADELGAPVPAHFRTNLEERTPEPPR